jgi:hypothetical protein
MKKWFSFLAAAVIGSSLLMAQMPGPRQDRQDINQRHYRHHHHHRHHHRPQGEVVVVVP